MSDHPKEREIPFILVGVGVALYIIGSLLRGGHGQPSLVGILIIGSIQATLLVGAAFIVSTLLSISFGEVKSAALKFAGIALVSGGISAAIPFGWIIGLFVFLGLIVWLFEIEYPYAIALTFTYWVVSFVVGLIVVAALR